MFTRNKGSADGASGEESRCGQVFEVENCGGQGLAEGILVFKDNSVLE